MTRTGSGAQQTIDRREALRRAALLLGVEGLPLGPSAREGSRATSSTEQFLARKYDLGEVERELSAQVERALRSDLKIDYVDYHMGTAVATPALRAVVERIAQKYNLGISRYFGEAYHTMFDRPIVEKQSAFHTYLARLTPGTLNLVVVHAARATPEMSVLST